MSWKIKISVVMGVFNPRNVRNLLISVDSIINQSFKAWEMIIYDDGSDDKYAGIIKNLSGLDERILHIRDNKNRGLGYALNKCIKCSSGEYIARMDDDDISLPERLRKQYEFLETNPRYEWVGSNARLINGKGVSWGAEKVPEIPKSKDFLFNSPYIHPSVMFRKEALLENGGYSISKRYLGCEDYELFMRLHRNGARGYNIQEVLFQYRENNSSYIKRSYSRRIREMKLRYSGFKGLGILNGRTFVYVLKPLIVGAIPGRIYYKLKKYLNKRKIK